MTTSQRSVETMSKQTRDAIVDRLRACQTEEEILTFESWFNTNANAGSLHALICDFLRSRHISRVLGAKLLCTLINDRDKRLKI